MSKIKFPSAQTILIIIAFVVAGLTWIVPSGQYDRLAYNAEINKFEQSGALTKIYPATQVTLDELGMVMPVEKFINGDIWKPVGIPGTYHQLESKPQGLVEFIQSPIKGISQAMDVILFVLIIGGFIGIVHHSGAFDSGIARLAERLKGREMWLIIIIMILIALGGTTFGLAEETIAFFPILIPVFIAAAYDALVAIAAIFLGSAIGSMASTVNPFSSIIASDAAGINWTTGIIGRCVMLILGTGTCIWYTVRYAEKIKNDPTKSLVYDQHQEHNSMFALKKGSESIVFDWKIKTVLLLFAFSFVVMIWGVSSQEWWFLEMTTLFFVAAIIIGFVTKIGESKFVDVFVKGAADLLGVAFIIGIARGVTVLMEDGLISDTLLFYSSNLVEGMPKGLFSVAMFVIYAGLSFFVPSSSGMAVLTMPIFAPLADVVGVGREVVIDTYQYGQGLFYFINPTGLILASLAVGKIGFDKWLKFVWPLFLMLVVLSIVMLVVGVYV